MSDMFGSQAPVTFPVRPLTKGMNSNISSLALPDGSFVRVLGYDISENGPRRIDPFVNMIRNPVPFWDAANEHVDAIESFMGTSNYQYTVAITNKGMYRVEHANIDPSDTYDPVYWVRDYTVNSYVSGTGILGITGNNFTTDKVRVGDYVVLAADTAVPPTRHLISNVGTTTITIPTGLTIAGSASFNILRMFKPEDNFVVDFTSFARSDKAAMVLVDGSAYGIFYYDGGFLSEFTLHDQLDAATYTSARTVTHFGGRFYFGCVGKDIYVYTNRLIWTDVLDLQEVNAISYQDLTGTPGQALKLVSLGSLIFCYFNDGVYFGRQTNLVGLPYAFTKLDTGGISAVGMRAVTPFLDGQIFVGLDDIYYVTPQGGLEPIGSPVMRDTVALASRNGTIMRTQVRVDNPRNRLVFGFVTQTGNFFQIGALFNYRVKAWSLFDMPYVSAFNIVNFVDDTEYGDLPNTAAFTYAAFTVGIDPTYAMYGTNLIARQFTLADYQGYLYFLATGGTSHDLSTGLLPVNCVIETGDFDFNAPDVDKTALQFRIKLNTIREFGRTTDVDFLLETSNDRGDSWKRIGILSVPPSKSEGSLNFRITGSTLRFRLTSQSIVEPYEINEYTLRINARGYEPSRSSTSSNP